MKRCRIRRGFTLLELLAVVTIMGIITAMAVSRISTQALDAKKKCCLQFRADLNSAIERFHFDHGAFPTQLSDLEGEYYPETIPNCPVDNSAYQIDAASNWVQAHNH
jgi:prepilin-type N-terminal cleavage/methylation domain-containing protein